MNRSCRRFNRRTSADLIEATTSTDEAAARQAVDADKVAAAIIIPAGFTEKIIPAGLQQGDFSALMKREQGVVEVYASPERPISASIVRSIVNAVLNRMTTAGAAAQTSITQLLISGYVSPQDMQQVGNEIGMRAGEQASQGSSLKLTVQSVGAQTNSGGFDWMAYMAPSMAVLFLMFTVSLGGRSILAERQWGTLQRLLISPSSAAQVLGGKVSGIFLTGLAQMVILIAFSALAFGVRWGAPVALDRFDRGDGVRGHGLGRIDRRVCQIAGAGHVARLDDGAGVCGLGRQLCAAPELSRVAADAQPRHAECVGAGRI